MPYTARKEGDKYVVYKKDSGKRVGSTVGNKESLRKYLTALHMNAESIDPMIESNKPIKLASLVKLREGQLPTEKMDSTQKRAFLEAVYNFAGHSNNIYRPADLKETSKALGQMIEAASALTLHETEDWFDNVTVGRHMKHLGEAHKIFEKTAHEIGVLQQRLESAYEDIGGTLSKYYDVNSMVSEASTVQQEGAGDKSVQAGAGTEYRTFFNKAMKKFNIQNPGDLESDKDKKKLFKWVDTNYNAKDEPGKDGEVKKKEKAPKEEEPKKKEVTESRKK